MAMVLIARGYDPLNQRSRRDRTWPGWYEWGWRPVKKLRKVAVAADGMPVVVVYSPSNDTIEYGQAG